MKTKIKITTENVVEALLALLTGGGILIVGAVVLAVLGDH